MIVGRVLPTLARRSVGPFLFLDHMGPTDAELVVRPHPHLHLATVTYLFDGEIHHRDSLGSDQVIAPGAVNWMVAGRGIAHSERPTVPAAPHLHGLQIWVGLPRSHEDTEPSFAHTPASALPSVDEHGARIRVVAGAAYGATSPVATMSPLFYVDVQLEAGAEVALPAEHAERAAYIVEGAVTVDGASIGARHMAVFARGGAPALIAEQPTRLVLLGGEPLDGPRYMWWNFVSSSKEKIDAAKEDWKQARFAIVPGDDKEFIPLP